MSTLARRTSGFMVASLVLAIALVAATNLCRAFSANLQQLALVHWLDDQSMDLASTSMFSPHPRVIPTNPVADFLDRECLCSEHHEPSARGVLWASVNRLVAGEYTESTVVLERALKMAPNDELIPLYLGIAQWHSGEHGSALESWLGDPGLAVYFARQGDEFFAQGLHEQAVQAWSISNQIDATPRWQKTGMYLALCEMRREEGKDQEAIYWCQTAILATRNWPVHFAVGQQYLAMDKPLRAAEIADALIGRADLGPSGRNQAHRLLAWSYVRLGDYQRAVEQYKLIQDPDGYVLIELGELYLRMERPDEARMVFEHIIALDGEDVLSQRAQEHLDQLEVSGPEPSLPQE